VNNRGFCDVTIDRVLEACLYAADLDAAEQFYTQVLGLERYSSVPGRHVFFRVADGMFLIFNPERTSGEPSLVGGAIVPTHGATGPGHVAFAIPDAEIATWRNRIEAAGVSIESEVNWPRGGRSLYFRDPAGNCVELASPKLWGFPDPAPDGR
jgi:catechol 2,3-dioxygenase-like lactoylglutathione lyase family enzyme